MKSTILLVIAFCIIYCNTQNNKQEEPALKIQLNPPEQTAKDTIQALQDLDKLENEIRIGMNEDFEDEKRKLIEIQKARVHDIVHGGFIALQSLIPNPIKASIRKGIRDQIKGKGISNTNIDSSKSENALKTEKVENEMNNLTKNIRSLSSFKQINHQPIRNKEDEYIKSITDQIKEVNKSNLGYEDNNHNFLQKENNYELYNINTPVFNPL